MEFYVYLIGPIKGLSYDEAVDWRVRFAKSMPPEIVCLSPMRHKEFLEGEEELDASHYSQILASWEGVKFRDEKDIRACDLVVAYFVGASDKSIGSCWEIGFAEALNKPVVVVLEDGDVHNHPFIVIGNLRLHSLEEAIDIVPKILLP